MAIDFESIVKSYCTPAASNDGYTFKSIKVSFILSSLLTFTFLLHSCRTYFPVQQRIQACSNIILREIVSAPRNYYDGSAVSISISYSLTIYVNLTRFYEKKMIPKELGVKPQSRPFEFMVLDGNYAWMALPNPVVVHPLPVASPVPKRKSSSHRTSPMRTKSPKTPIAPAETKIGVDPVLVEPKPIETEPPKAAVSTSLPNTRPHSILDKNKEKDKESTVTNNDTIIEGKKSSTDEIPPSPLSTMTNDELEFETPTTRARYGSTLADTNSTSPSILNARCDLSLRRMIGYTGGPAVLVYGGALLLCAVGPIIVLVDLQNAIRETPSTGLWRAFQDRSSSGNVKYEQSFLRGHRNKIGLIEVCIGTFFAFI
jgi:hypothetical protein